MALLINLVFLLFGVCSSVSSTFWRFFLLSLLCQLIAQWTHSVESLEPVQWSLEWLVPLFILLIGMNKDAAIFFKARLLFLFLWILCLCSGFWDSFYSKELLQAKHQILPKTQTTVYQAAPESTQPSQEEWETITSPEGRFKVLSPLPAVTHVSYKKIQDHELKLTTTKIKDVDNNTYFVILTTHYEASFVRPEETVQAQMALDHLLKTYQCTQLSQAEAIELNSYKALAFQTKSDQTGETVVGLVMPTHDVLYQLLVFSSDEKQAESKAERFLASFEPLRG